MPPRISPPFRVISLPLSATPRRQLPALLPSVPCQGASYSTPAGDDAPSEAPALDGLATGEDDPLHLKRAPFRLHKLQKRNRMKVWLHKQGPGFKWPLAKDARPLHFLPNATKNEDQPFPLNPEFRSQPVLSESAREDIWRRVVEKRESIKAVSVALNIDQRRVAAVVRMKEVEKRWVAEGKSLALGYSQTMMKLLPQTVYSPDRPPPQHEPINEIHVHSLTMQQLFVPVAESRHFTRQDAARAFGPRMLSADARIPHPELVQRERDLRAGMTSREAYAKFTVCARESEAKVVEQARQAAAELESRTTRVEGPRFEFRFTDVNVDAAGKGGRGRNGVGARYGVPFPDRKVGAIKFPTKMD